jgi:hypothetical protein
MSLVSLGTVLSAGLVLAGLSAGTSLAAVANNTVNVRSGPGVEYSAIGTLHSGQNAHITATDGDWCHVRKVGRDGWVLCDALDEGSSHYGYGNGYDRGYGSYGGYGPYGGSGYGYPVVPRLGFGFGLGLGLGGTGFGHYGHYGNGHYGHYGHHH